MVIKLKKLIKPLFIFSLGVLSGYYLCINNPSKIFDTSYKAFQVGVYTSLEAANTYKLKYDNAIVIKDNELYRIYVSILKEQDNIDSMSNYLNRNKIDFYIKDININNPDLKQKIREYENIMNNENEIVFLEINKMIITEYEEML